jgi:hypothetical protein
VLYYCPDYIFKKIKRIFLEHHKVDFKDRYNPEALKEFLEAKGFKVDRLGEYLYARNKHLTG